MTNREEMTNRQAIDLLEEVSDCDDSMYAYNPAYMLALDLAISALEKQEQTKEAIPHRNYQYLSDYWCECGWHLGKKGDVKFCADCGRRIKWD